MHGGGNGPAHRVRQIQHCGRMIHLKDRRYPQQPQPAGPYHGHDHGHYRVPQSTQRAHHHVHHAAQAVQAADIFQPQHGMRNNLLLAGRVDRSQRMPEEYCQISKNQAKNQGIELAEYQRPVHPAALPRAVVLAGEGQVRLIKGVHGYVDEPLDIGGSRRPGHDGRGAEGVDGGLDHHIGQGEYNSLETGRQSHLQDPFHNTLVQMQLPQVQMQRPLIPHQAAQHQQGGHRLRDDGSQRHSRHTHPEHDDKQQIQRHIGHSGDSQVVQRTPGVPLGPKDGRAEVIEHVHRHPGKIDPQIDGGQIDHVRRGRGPDQQLPGQSHPQHRQKHAADERDGDGGVDAAAYILLPAAPHVTGHHHVGTHGEAHEQVDQQVDKGAGRPHGGQRRLSCTAAHHHHVGGVKQQLQQAGKHKRQGKQQDLPRQRTMYHIHPVSGPLRLLRRHPIPLPDPGIF